MRGADHVDEGLRTRAFFALTSRAILLSPEACGRFLPLRAKNVLRGGGITERARERRSTSDARESTDGARVAFAHVSDFALAESYQGGKRVDVISVVVGFMCLVIECRIHPGR